MLADALAGIGVLGQPQYLFGNILGAVCRNEEAHLTLLKVVCDAAVGRTDDGQAKGQRFENGGGHSFAKGGEQVKVALSVGLLFLFSINRAPKRDAALQPSLLHIRFHSLLHRGVFTAATDVKGQMWYFLLRQAEGVDGLVNAFCAVNASQVQQFSHLATALTMLNSFQQAVIDNRRTQKHGYAKPHCLQLIAKFAAEYIDKGAFSKYPAHQTR